MEAFFFIEYDTGIQKELFYENIGQLEVLRSNDTSCEAFFSSRSHEPFFIKNLENVQGDERDVIFISIGYGRTKAGKVSMSLGPLNKEGGERRLNVLISRARQVCEVFTNLTADDMDISKTYSKGVRVLKTFIHYVEQKQLNIDKTREQISSNSLDKQIQNKLENIGFKVVPQVGNVDGCMDLAIVHPKKGNYFLGIECDGENYHNYLSTRDRDRLRPQVLKNLGWHVHRIWSKDWFDNSQEICLAIEKVVLDSHLLILKFQI